MIYYIITMFYYHVLGKTVLAVDEIFVQPAQFVQKQTNKDQNHL